MYEYEIMFIDAGEVKSFITFAHDENEAVEYFIWSQVCDVDVIVSVINHGYVD